MTEAKFKKQTRERVTLPLSVYRYRARKNSSASAIWLAAENIQKIHLFSFSKSAEV